ncbi:MAG: hypothetical protein KC731_30780, partial [Myxococcales bacterium]|nr:hypothetical protein [Myxococcales bacterium]
YCEENVWQQLADPQLGEGRRYAVFVTNAAKLCPLWAQRAGDPVFWDYHVFAIVAGEGEVVVWDLDSLLGAPIPLTAYLAGTFPGPLPSPDLAPLFRLVEAEAFHASFRSDRSHMRRDGRWLKPPPPWPPLDGPGPGSNLQTFLDVHDASHGPWLDRDALGAFFAPRH